MNTQVEFKSHQWFGATVRSHGNSILVRMGGLVGLFGQFTLCFSGHIVIIVVLAGIFKYGVPWCTVQTKL